MVKIKLSLDDLNVESFTTSVAGRDLGTVFGHEKTDATCAGVTGCGAECDTWYGNGACSADDNCASAPYAYTPCAGCADTPLCGI